MLDKRNLMNALRFAAGWCLLTVGVLHASFTLAADIIAVPDRRQGLHPLSRRVRSEARACV